jgi:hypothetical protein
MEISHCGAICMLLLPLVRACVESVIPITLVAFVPGK